jgi:hypothetical protein
MAEEIKETEVKNEQPKTPAEKTYSEADYNALKVKLDEANQAIQSFKDMDIESIQKSADEWKQKAEALEQAQKERDYSDKLDKFVQSQGMKNDIYAAHLKGLLKDAELKFDKDGSLIGGADIVQKLKESCPDAFAGDKPKPEFVGSTSGNTVKTPDDDAIRRIMGLK